MEKNGVTVLRILMFAGGLFLAFQPVGGAVANNTATPETMERRGIVTMKGNPITLIGPEIQVGQHAPDFLAQATDLRDVSLAPFKGKVLLIASVPSVDTPVCDAEIRRFNQEAVQVSNDVAVLFISMDLPFAQKRFCAGAGIKNVIALSDHLTADFGRKYGVLIKENRLLSRAIFIIAKDGTVRYVEYVKENGSHPDYERALKELKDISR